MEDIWEILQLRATVDRNAIKKAYAKQAKKYNPEDAPEEFWRLREAYEKALAYAEDPEGVRNGSLQVGSEGIENAGIKADTSADKSIEPEAAVSAGTIEATTGKAESAGKTDTAWEASQANSCQSDFQWELAQENPFRDGEGIRRFRELYTGKRRKAPVAWTDFFLSDAFLEGYREEDFVKLMYEVVSENASEFPPGKEFLTALYIVYGLRADKRQEGMELEMDADASFPGMEYIGKIAGMGAAVTRLKGSEPAMAEAYRDYRNLLELAREDIWDDEAVLALGKIINRYMLGDISDKPIIRHVDQYEFSQRHPKSLKLITYFFVHTKEAVGQQGNLFSRLPEKVYRLVWGRLGLEHATNGREKLLYGGLRDAVLAHVPDILDKPKVDYKKLTHDFFYDYHGSEWDYYGNEGKTPEEREVLDKFLEREDVQHALLDVSYVDKQISRYWVTMNSGDYLLDRLEEFYKSHLDAPFASHMIDRITEMRERKRIDREFQEDLQSVPVRGSVDFKNRAFLRYYLHTAFHLARGFREDVLLTEYLKERMPYSAEWSRQFVEVWEKEDSAGAMEIRLGEAGEDVLSVRFHSRYMEYLWNGSRRVPYFPGQALAEIERDDYFWLLVPVAVADYKDCDRLYEEMVKRLGRLPLQQEDIPVIADCIVGSICHYDLEPVPACRFYFQKEEYLFGYDVYEDGRVVLFEELSDARQRIAEDSYAPDVEAGVRMGWRMLKELSGWDGEAEFD